MLSYMKILKYLWLVLSCVLFISCKNSSNKIEINWQLRDDTYEIIQEYIRKYPQYNTYLMLPVTDPYKKKDIICNRELTIESTGFLLGPCYNFFLDKDFFHVQDYLSFKMMNKKIYIKTDMTNMYQDVDKKWENTVQIDSCLDDFGYKSKAFPTNYLKRAILIYQKNGKVFVNNKPDTLFSVVNKVGNKKNIQIKRLFIM